MGTGLRIGSRPVDPRDGPLRGRHGTIVGNETHRLGHDQAAFWFTRLSAKAVSFWSVAFSSSSV